MYTLHTAATHSYNDITFNYIIQKDKLCVGTTEPIEKGNLEFMIEYINSHTCWTADTIVLTDKSVSINFESIDDLLVNHPELFV